ncbi:7630_t:CDS:1, partial [Gigaspora rosea]
TSSKGGSPCTKKRKFVKVDMEDQQVKIAKTCEAETRDTAESAVMISTEKRNQENGCVLMQGLSSGALDATSTSWADSTEQKHTERNPLVTDVMEEDLALKHLVYNGSRRKIEGRTFWNE